MLQPPQQEFEREHECQVASILNHGDAPFSADLAHTAIHVSL
jgi:hypothetical protein